MGPGLRPETSTSDGILGPIQLPCSVGQLAVAATSVTGRALSSVSPRPTRASRLASATIPLRSGAGPLHPSLRPRVATTTVCRPRILAGPCITAILHRLRSPGFDRASGFYLAADQSRRAIATAGRSRDPALAGEAHAAPPVPGAQLLVLSTRLNHQLSHYFADL